ncbi:MerR family transcriptional regulator [Thermomonospora umbrina]|uniref:MerR-like DNA binding protein n=1 Tax=Thermomonospora umbrina TaxID=111806 RepID=A0A3D9SQB7_9ACTN|nr:MerR family transcriptional regulator [Thermomonospora umbrina]REE97817.1 MerR-like DNA binding protein [Thermomonospora umbrina]
MATYRIDDLARAADTTVRNVRAFQERGVLPAPQRHGRIGLYDDSHLARIRLVVQLQSRGYTIATIAELISAWERGHNLSELLGLEKVLTDPWSDEIPGHLTVTELGDMFFPDLTPDERAALPPEQVGAMLSRAEALGFIEPAGDRYKVPSPRLLHVGAELVAAGIPLDAVFDIADQVSDDCETIAQRFIRLTVDHTDLEDSTGDIVREHLPELAEVIARLRPLALMTAQALLARAMQDQIRSRFSEQVASIARHTAEPT